MRTRPRERNTETAVRESRPLSLDRREEVLLRAFVLGVRYEQALAHPDVSLDQRRQSRFKRLAALRASGVPLAYLTGTKSFYGRDFSVGQGILVPRPETEHVVDAALALVPKRWGGTVADIGAGSGCIGITIACERPNASVVLIDRSARAVRVAGRNAARFRVADRVRVLQGNYFTPLLSRHVTPDLIVTNLPYATPSEYRSVRHEPRTAIVGGHDGLAAYRGFFAAIRRAGFMRTPCILETDPRRMSATKALAVPVYGRSASYEIVRDLAGWKRVLVITPRGIRRLTSRSPAGRAAPPQPRSVPR